MINNCFPSQGFGQNANEYYASVGLKGHTGQDSWCGYGTPIYAEHNMYVYKVITPDNAGSIGYTGVFGIVDDGVELFEWEVGHCDPLVKAGDWVKKGDLIATEANHGKVYSGNREITVAMQRAGNKEGSHRHIQKRPVQRLKNPTGQCLSKLGWKVYRDTEGYAYEVWDYYNGFNGCIDPNRPVFFRNLTVGMSGYDVYCLQRHLIGEGLASYEPTGYFGGKTLMSVVAYQKRYNISPALGFVGPATRKFINSVI